MVPAWIRGGQPHALRCIAVLHFYMQATALPQRTGCSCNQLCWLPAVRNTLLRWCVMLLNWQILGIIQLSRIFGGSEFPSTTSVTTLRITACAGQWNSYGIFPIFPTSCRTYRTSWWVLFHLDYLLLYLSSGYPDSWEGLFTIPLIRKNMCYPTSQENCYSIISISRPDVSGGIIWRFILLRFTYQYHNKLHQFLFFFPYPIYYS